MKSIIIVESPSKSKTIESYMGSDYKVLSSIGHIRDLATSGKDGLGIDIEDGFKPNYTIIKTKEKIVKNLKKEIIGKQVFLATDPDREGEAISYHLAEVLNLDLNEANRIEFHEITKPAIKEAFLHPRKINLDLVASQETRRMLDRIIGFKVSKLLQNKIKSKSAGRVQSVALKLICDLEKEITSFVSTPYYELEALFSDFKLEFVSYKNSKKTIENKELALEIKNSLNEEFNVSDIEKKEVKRESKPAYTTSTLQQDASNKLNFSASKTMKVAQSLYEGKKLSNEETGLITYMRTDSTYLSDVFVKEANNYIINKYTESYLGHKKIRNQKLAQGAHEAIRPTDINKTPQSVSKYLTPDEFKLYSLIYKRTLASLMKAALFINTKVTFTNNETVWKLTGQRLVFDGYLSVYGKEEDDENSLLPEFMVNQAFRALSVEVKELFTKPKSRYTEATLIKDMEELGIGRPSTYAQTMTTLTERDYITIKEKKLHPTEQGMLTNDKLAEFFTPIINVKYTAQMEGKLDLISKGEAKYQEELNSFYQDFLPIFEVAKKNMTALPPQETGEICPECSSPLVIRKGKYGEFVACGNYPSCRYVKPTVDDSVDTNVICPKCHEGHLIRKTAKTGRNKGKYFYACGNYPSCKTIFNDEPTNEKCPNCGSILLNTSSGLKCSMNCQSEEGIICPKCHKGHLVKKVAKRGSNAGKEFYACNNYPRCKTVYNGTPTDKVCSKCGELMIIVDGKEVCSNKEC